MTPQSNAEPFETETMAELCARQGRFGAAIAIYRNLLQAHPSHASARRWASKLAELEEAWDASDDTGDAPTLPHEVAIPGAPGVVVATGQDAQGESAAIVAWALPPTSTPPVLEVMLVLKGPDGIETVRKQVAVSASSGRIALAAPGLHSAIAACGIVQHGVFLPLARSALPSNLPPA